MLGEFPSTATDTLIPLKHIEEAVGRELADASGDDAIMGLDIARFGDDRSVACIRRGPAVVGLWVFPSSDVMTTTGRALDLARVHEVVKINVDEVGLGAGVLDRMQEIGSVEAEGINGGRKANEPERYANLRAEMFDDLRLRFQSGEISICDDAELISELASLKYSFTSRGQIRLEDKQALRSSGRPSPDKADAVMLAFAKGRENPVDDLDLRGRRLAPFVGTKGARAQRAGYARGWEGRERICQLLLKLAFSSCLPLVLLRSILPRWRMVPDGHLVMKVSEDEFPRG